MSDPALPSGSPWDAPDALAAAFDLGRNADLARNYNPRIGMAYAVQLRTDADPRRQDQHRPDVQQSVLIFRLRRVGPDGQLLPPVAVELRGATVSGEVRNGDLVQLPRRAPHGGALKLTSLTNLTTGAPVYAGTPKPGRAVWAALVVLLALVVLGVVVAAGLLLPLLTGL